jgi:hypothetical protein
MEPDDMKCDMKKAWKSSCFTHLVACDSGDLLLHNSFMGAVARIPAYQATRIRTVLQQGIEESDSDDPAIRNSASKAFRSSDLEERRIIEHIDKERLIVSGR